MAKRCKDHGGRTEGSTDCPDCMADLDEELGLIQWTQVNNNRWVRNDGAVVMWDQRSPWPNPIKKSARMWTAWEPDPSGHYIATVRGRFRTCMDGSVVKPSFPRRWKTAESAMKSVDKLFPLQEIPNG